MVRRRCDSRRCSPSGGDRLRVRSPLHADTARRRPGDGNERLPIPSQHHGICLGYPLLEALVTVKSLRWPVVIVGFALLTFGTVLVFMAFDRDSHSASDTIRPFLITMTPVWVVAVAAAVVLLRRPETR